MDNSGAQRDRARDQLFPASSLCFEDLRSLCTTAIWWWFLWKNIADDFLIVRWKIQFYPDVMLLNTGHWTGFVSESINHPPPTFLVTNRPVDGPSYCILECRTSRCWLVPLGYLQNIPPSPGSLRVIPTQGRGDFLRAQGYHCNMGIIWRQYHTI